MKLAAERSIFLPCRSRDSPARRIAGLGALLVGRDLATQAVRPKTWLIDGPAMPAAKKRTPEEDDLSVGATHQARRREGCGRPSAIPGSCMMGNVDQGPPAPNEIRRSLQRYQPARRQGDLPGGSMDFRSGDPPGAIRRSGIA